MCASTLRLLKRIGLVVGVFVLLGASTARGAVRYVDPNSTAPTVPFTNWSTAARTIQDAVDAAIAGDEVVVTNGILRNGGRTVGTNQLLNRVMVDKPIRLRSVNGPTATVIHGAGWMRCVYLVGGAVLEGFTLSNGATLGGPKPISDCRGGGVWCDSSSALLTNCTLTGNSAAENGGGAYGGTLNNCTLTNNSAVGSWWSDGFHSFYGDGAGGGAAAATLNNCLVIRNDARTSGGGAVGCVLNNCLVSSNSARASYDSYRFYGGGGVSGCTLNNCTVTDNSTFGFGGGESGSTVKNCIVYYNTASMAAPNFSGNPAYCCTTPIPTSGVGNITNEPLFVDRLGGDFRLQSTSPCINAGYNAYAANTSDCGGNPRIVGSSIDMGAYELQTLGSVSFQSWLRFYGLPTNGSADFNDSDGDGHNNWQEWRCQTDPTIHLSALRLLSEVPVSSNVTITWQSVPGVRYFLESCTNALKAQFTILVTNIAGQVTTTSYTDTNAAGRPSLLYRVGVGN